MGGKPAPHRARSRQIGAAVLVAATMFACDSDDPTASDAVGSADAIAAVVAWQAGEQEPVLGDDGRPRLPVIFIVADDGATIGVGVQAEVAEATADWARVRFADDVADTFDRGAEGEPVRDDGAMLLLGSMPDPAPMIELDAVRYTSVEDAELLTFEISSETPADGTDATGATDGEAPPRPGASVTAVTRP